MRVSIYIYIYIYMCSSHQQLKKSPALTALDQILLPNLTVTLLNVGKNKIFMEGCSTMKETDFYMGFKL